MAIPKADGLPLDIYLKQVADVRGSYGYGRRSHGSDPQATYHFEKPASPTEAKDYVDEIAKDYGDPKI